MLKKIILIFMLLFVIQFETVLAADNSGTSQFQSIVKAANSGEDSLVIYKDIDRDFILYYMEGKVHSYLKGNDQAFSSDYCGNYAVKRGYIDADYYDAQVSPDKDSIVFFDDKARTYIYSVSMSALKTIPVPLARLIWNVSGNDYSYAFKRIIAQEGMQNYHLIQLGLYFKSADSSIKQIIADDKSVEYLKKDADGVHFSVRQFTEALDFLVNGQHSWKEEIVYNEKTGSLNYVPHLPEGAEVIVHKKLTDYTRLLENCAVIPGGRIYFSGNYVLAPIMDRYIRLNKITKKVKTIPVPMGAYKGNIYCFKTPYTTGPFYKMNIASLKVPKYSVGYASSYGFVFWKNKLYYLNPQTDKLGNHIDVPYACNLDNGRRTKVSNIPDIHEYHVFTLNDHSRLCVYFEHGTNAAIHLEDSCGRIIIPQVMEYSNGYFYQTGLSEDNYPVINKVGANGKIIKEIFKASDRSAQFTSMKVNGNDLFFTTAYSLYSCDLSTGKYKKY